jgi:hypothetical protein
MILDKGSGFLHLLDDIATEDCFRGTGLVIGISHEAGNPT